MIGVSCVCDMGVVCAVWCVYVVYVVCILRARYM